MCKVLKRSQLKALVPDHQIYFLIMSVNQNKALEERLKQWGLDRKIEGSGWCAEGDDEKYYRAYEEKKWSWVGGSGILS